MTFKLFTILLGLAALVLFALLKFLKGDVKIFIKKTNYYLLGAALVFALFGTMGWFIRTNALSATTVAWMFQVACLGLGMLHVWMLFHVLAWPNRAITHLEWLFTLLVMAVGASTFFQCCIYFEKVKRNLDAAFADEILPGLLLFPVPLLCVRLWDIWNNIPRVNITGWQLPLDMRPPVIEPGKSVKLTFLVHAQYNTGQLIQIDVLAPAERTVGETFHYLLYRHNVEKQSYNQIIVAENNSRSKAYSWLFYRKEKFLWFWNRKNYLNADHRIRQLNLQNGEIIYIERVRHWLHQA